VASAAAGSPSRICDETKAYSFQFTAAVGHSPNAAVLSALNKLLLLPTLVPSFSVRSVFVDNGNILRVTVLMQGQSLNF
jgi:hypothetical protein